ncbi:MAG TPA: IPT/TIG domain-containing protein [Streptomyces sp.]
MLFPVTWPVRHRYPPVSVRWGASASILPDQGSIGGGTWVTLMTLTGTSLTGSGAVRFGSRPATSITDVSPARVTAVAPSGAGAVKVTVAAPGRSSNPVPFFCAGAPSSSP